MRQLNAKMSVDKGKTQHYRKLIERRHILTSFKQFVLHTLKMALCFTTISSLYTTQVLAKEERYKVIQPFNTPRTSTASVSAVSHLYDTSDGSVGRLTIGGYTAELYNSFSQSVVDAADSAVYYDWGNNICIADHAYQGFSIIRSLGPGAQATITNGSQVTYLTMIASYQGTNTGHGVNLADGTYAETVPASYCMYTCNDETGKSVTVTYWNVTGTGTVAPAAPVAEEAAPAYVEQASYEAPVQAQVYTKSDAQIQAEKQAEIEAQQQAEEEARKAEDARIAEEKKAEAEQSLALHSYVETTECESNEEVMESIREKEQAELDKKAEQKQKLTNDIAIGVTIVASCVGLILACI